MKTILLNLIAFFTLIAMVNAQTTYLDFETISPIAYEFGGNAHEFMVDNPSTEGNTSAKVAKITTGSETWSGDAYPVGGTINFSANDNVFTIDVYSDIAGDVVFKVEKAGDNTVAAEVTASYDSPNTWKTLEFVFPDNLEAGVYGQLVLFFNFGTTEATVWYFDNVTGPEVTFGSSTLVNFIIDDKLGQAENVALKVDDEDLALTADGKIWTGEKTLAPYNMLNGGGEYEIIVVADGADVDTAKLSITGGGETLDWNYLLLNEEIEDGTAECKYTSAPPEIDGTIDAIWDNVKAHPLQQREWWGTATGIYSWYKMMWDDDNFYLLNYVEDKTLVNGMSEPYENDNVEIFFDMGREKANSGEGFDDNDYQIRYIWNDETYTGTEGLDEAWATSNGVQRAQSTLDGDVGYTMEWKIPWEALAGITIFVPFKGSQFDFDVVISDNTGASRAYIIAWNTYLDQNYKNTSLYGTVTLSETDANSSVKSIQASQFKVYSQPGLLSVSGVSEIKSLEIYSLLGKQIVNIEVNAFRSQISLPHMSPGVYIVQVKDANGEVYAQKILIE